MLEGSLTDSEQRELTGRMDGGEFFVAEQVGVPSLYADLYEFSGGRTADDQCWHEFAGFQPMDEAPEDSPIWGRTEDFLKAFRGVKRWDLNLSPHSDFF